MRRVFRLPESASFRPSLTVVPTAGADLATLLERGQPFSATASSTAVADMRSSALAALDGDPGTTWTAKASDLRPTLSLSWLGEREVSGLALSIDQDAAARRPQRIVLTWPGGRTTVSLDDRGRARFPAVRTDRMTLRLDTTEPAADLGFDRSLTPVAVGISELAVTGVPFFPARLPVTPVRYPCGTGPDVTVNGAAMRTSVTAAPADLIAMKPASAKICGVDKVALRPGGNVVDVSGSSAFGAGALVLRGDRLEHLPVVSSASGLVSETPVQRVVRVAEGMEVLGLRENANPGWSATQHGRPVPSLVVDGWQQAFDVTGRGGSVTVVFEPDRTYRWGLAAGLAGLAALVLVVLVTTRRSRGRAVSAAPGHELRPTVWLALGTLGAGLLAGWTGVLVGTVGWLLAVMLRSRMPDGVCWVLGGCASVASLAYVVRPWGGETGWAGDLAWPHYFLLVSVAGVFALSGAPSTRSVGPPRRRRLIAGRSSHR